MRAALSGRDTSRRAAAIGVVRDLVLAAPHELAGLLPILQTAVFVEVRARHAGEPSPACPILSLELPPPWLCLQEPPLRHLALSALLDAAFGVATSPAADAPGEATTTLCSLLSWAPSLLNAPGIQLQAIAAIGLARLPLHATAGSLVRSAPEANIPAAWFRERAGVELSP